MSDRYPVTVYFDSEEEKKTFRVRAASEGKSMSELALEALRALFLHEVSYEADNHPSNGTPAA